MNTVENGWICWLAGILDGEGTVSIGRSTGRAKEGYRFDTHHRSLVQVAGTDVRLIDRASDVIESITGRRPRRHPVKRCKATQKLGWAIQVTTSWEVNLLLPAVLPWLVIKHEQADIVLSFSKRHTRSGYKGARSQETFDLDELDYARCRILNRRGNHGGPDIDEMERMVASASAVPNKEE